MDQLLGMLLPVALMGIGAWAILWVRPQMLGHLREMKFMNTSTVQELLDTCRTMEESGIGEGFRSYVELKGKVVAEHPVRTPFSDQAVAYCSSRLTAVTEVEETYRKEDGTTGTRIRKQEDVLTTEESSQVLLFKDASADVKVVLDISNGCRFDIPETFDRFEPVANLGRYSYFRNFRYNRPNLQGYRMREKTVPLQQSLYVLGEAYMEGDTLHVGKPLEKDQSFIVSTRSEDQLTGKYESNGKLALFGGIAGIAAGLLWLLITLLK